MDEFSLSSVSFPSGTRNIWLSELFSPFVETIVTLLGSHRSPALTADPANMTIENCVAFCDSQPVSYRFMALTEGFECCTSSAKDMALSC